MDCDGARVWSIALTALLACGPVVGSSDAGESGDDTGTSPASSDEAGASQSSGADATESADDDGNVDEDSTGAPAVPMCGHEEPLAPIAVLASDDEASVLRADASRVPLDLPPSTAPVDASVSMSFAARGDHVAFARTWTVIANGLQHGSEVALLAATGEPIWTSEEPDATVAGLYLGADGSIVASRSVEGGEGQGVLYTAVGQAIALPSIYPSGAQRSDGWVPGHVVSAQGIARPGWIAAENAELREVSFEMHGGWFPTDDGEFIYLASDDDGASLVRESPVALETVPLAGADLDPLWMSASPDRSWALVGHNDGSAWWRVSLSDGEVEPLELAPASGFTTLECYGPAASIDDAGRIVLSVRDASSAVVHRLDPGVRPWTAIGEPVTQVDTMGASIHGETYVVRSDAQGTTFCPPQSFEPGAATLSGAVLQLVRPVDGVAHVFPADAAWASPSPDGRCVALVDARTTMVLDLHEDTELALAEPLAITWWR